MKKYIVIFLIALALLAAGSVQAADYPNKPIRFVVPFPAGGYSDVLARIFSQKLSENLGQPIIIENRPGASGNIGAEVVARTEPDGYTFLVTSTNLSTNPSLFKKLPFDPLKSFTHVSLISESPLLVVVHPSTQVHSMKELIALLKAKPGQIRYGSSGIGTTPHLIGELIKISTGTNMKHVPYKGGGKATAAMLSGEIHVGFPYLAATLPHIKSGKLEVIAVTTKRRATALPQVPTIAESVLPEFNVSGWLGLTAPAGTPKEIISLFEREIAKVVQQKDFRDKFKSQGAEPVGSTSQTFTERIPVEIAKWKKVVTEAGITPR